MSSRRDDILPNLPNPYMGVLPVNAPDATRDKQQPRTNAATAASAASVRAITSQAIAFYFRAPVKAFFRTRVDYLAYARSVHQAQMDILKQAASNDRTASRVGLRLRQAWQLLRGTTPGLLTSAIREHGWGVIPQQILPPLIANVTVGAVLYTSYLQILGQLHEESGRATKRVYPPPGPAHTFTAGFLAGSIQSVVAAPLDAIQARYDHRDLMPASGKGKPKSMWAFSADKLREIGPRGIFAGWGLSFMKDGFGSAIFFSMFEFVKAQGYYGFVTWYYGGLSEDIVNLLARKGSSNRRTAVDATESNNETGKPAIIRPHYTIEPIFLLLAGISASFAQQVLLHPLTYIQVKHWDHLEELDAKAGRIMDSAAADAEKPRRKWRMLRAYYRAYQETWSRLLAQAASEGVGLTHWLYRGFWWNTIRQVPSTSAGLIIFELVRRKYGMGNEEVRITKDGYDILLR
ncbi:mitochondrial carrier domain-containing protein [Pseudomassariella vexata]|uniref:Mitochondrial carrier domain-containing protein n=1 Tax=Pseudomassariella vexata TaxID=1141098 RepID=A0A1Y2EJ95_9PEZI|nr:mitochondrial carrier domain-containing protein [Pseudomassariella vexata]ORY71316.1 mitochondrial carrier domain-containing protein [Pseudomassariella vexata]